VNTTWTWVEVSSAETISASHLRLTRSSTTVAATPARGKWVVSKIQIELEAYSTQSGNGLRIDRPGRGSGRNLSPSRSSTRRTLAGDTHTRSR
jgi:hypothetical protein